MNSESPSPITPAVSPLAEIPDFEWGEEDILVFLKTSPKIEGYEYEEE